MEETDKNKKELILSLSKIMKEVGSVQKNGKNEFHRYDYATAADVMHKLQPLMAENGIVIAQNQKSIGLSSDSLLMMIEYEFVIMHSNGYTLDFRPVHTGIAAAKTSKGTPDDKAANKCHTCARKYFLLSLFQIPTGDYDDPDADGDVGPIKKGPEVKTEEIVFSDKIPDIFCEKIESLSKYKGIKIENLGMDDYGKIFKVFNSVLNGKISENSKNVIVQILEDISKRIHLNNSKQVKT